MRAHRGKYLYEITEENIYIRIYICKHREEHSKKKRKHKYETPYMKIYISNHKGNPIKEKIYENIFIRHTYDKKEGGHIYEYMKKI